MSHLDMHQFMCRSDNYGVLVHDHRTGATAAIDAPDAAVIERELQKRGWQLTHIWTTHHHEDHVAGNLALKEQFGCQIMGPAAEADRIPGIRKTVKGGETFQWAGREVKIYDCPGHTKGHIAYHIPAEFSLFAGDTLFAMGCGRVLEGSMEDVGLARPAAQAQARTLCLLRPRDIPRPTQVRPVGRARQPGIAGARQRRHNQRAKGRDDLPTTIGDELRDQSVPRPDSAEIRRPSASSRRATRKSSPN
jgi:hydroxyacylglutathione hydrolase